MKITKTTGYTEPSDAQVLSMSIDEVCMYLSYPDIEQSDRVDLANKLAELSKQVSELKPSGLISYYHFNLDEFAADNDEELRKIFSDSEELSQSYDEFVSDMYNLTINYQQLFPNIVWKVALDNV
ncbi:MAG: hypothetical protein U9N34_01555 [Candidatus Cloacimonadota bacterium]|nr:hypothetical protein [Candidatus Cloacimonadota bacterium]